MAFYDINIHYIPVYNVFKYIMLLVTYNVMDPHDTSRVEQGYTSYIELSSYFINE